MFLDIVPMHPSPSTNRSAFFRQTNIGNVIVSKTNIVQLLHHMYLQSQFKKLLKAEKGDTWLVKPSIANFSCRTLYGSYPMSVFVRYCFIGSYPKGGFLRWWSRRESNPRPKATWRELLRAQFVIYIPSSRREQTPYGIW